jgi:hypothetical protein
MLVSAASSVLRLCIGGCALSCIGGCASLCIGGCAVTAMHWNCREDHTAKHRCPAGQTDIWYCYLFWLVKLLPCMLVVLLMHCS